MKRLCQMLVVLGTVATGSSAAMADLIGSQVTVTGYCCVAPTEPFRQTVPLTKIVGPAIEFPAGSIMTTGGQQIISSNVDVGANFIDISYLVHALSSPGGFNGLVFDFVGDSLPAIIGVSLDPLTSFAASDIDLSFDVNSIFFSAPGVLVTVGSRVLIDIAFDQGGPTPMPVPATYLLLLGGLAVMAAVGRLRRKNSGRP